MLYDYVWTTIHQASEVNTSKSRIMGMKEVLILVLIISIIECISGSPDKCSSPETDMKFSVSSYRNQTGHWVAQVRLEHGGLPGKPGYENTDSGMWNVELEQTTKHCDGVQRIEILTTLTGPPPKAIPGYEYFPGVGYYKFYTAGKTWDEARKICEQDGGYLAVINSEAEAKVIEKYLAGVPKIEGVNHNDFAFIGFHDRFVEGEYVTVFGTSIASTGFTRWAGPGQPDNAGGNENCGSVHRNGGLNDIPCNWKLAYFCEQELW